jgi:hypothetical protein
MERDNIMSVQRVMQYFILHLCITMPPNDGKQKTSFLHGVGSADDNNDAHPKLQN